MPEEIKRPTTYAEQVQILRERNCYIADEVLCKNKLAAINYYRLSAYFLPFKDSQGNYGGVSFNRVYRIYEFDRKLRNILLSALEEVEIYLRSQLAYFHAHKYGAIGYLDANNFSKKHNHDKFREHIDREIISNESALFVKHHQEKYGGVFPVWVISELFTFGMLSYFYSDLTRSDQKEIATKLYGTVPQHVISWLRCCTDLRNICAHYGRLYFRIFPSIPGGIDMEESAQRKLWGAVLALKSLYPENDKWNYEVLQSLESLSSEYHGEIDLGHIAFPEDWAYQLKKR